MNSPPPQASSAAEDEARFAWLMLGWSIAAIVSVALACAAGAQTGPMAGALALGLAPSFVTLLLLPYRSASGVKATIVAAWLVAACGLAAGAGGALSPVVTGLALPPLVAAAIGLNAPARVGAASLLAVPAAEALAWFAPAARLSPGPEIFAVIVLALAVGLIGLRRAPGTALVDGLALVRVGADGRAEALTAESRRLLSWGGDGSKTFLGALLPHLSGADARALARVMETASAGVRANALVRLNDRTLDFAAAPEGSAVLISISDMTENLKATSQRVATISHELRTPLTHILGFAEMMQARVFGPLDQRYADYAELIAASGRNLLEMLNGLLDLARIEAGRYELDLEEFDAREIVEEVMRLASGSAGPKAIKLTTRLPQAPLRARADARALRQMLQNAVGNAVKFTPDGGEVVVEARAEGARLVLDTIDTGPGIPAEERARIARPYERGASGKNALGSGLGLALVKGFAELHGGRLSFHDAPTGGALVRLDLPVLIDAPRA